MTSIPFPHQDDARVNDLDALLDTQMANAYRPVANRVQAEDDALPLLLLQAWETPTPSRRKPDWSDIMSAASPVAVRPIAPVYRSSIPAWISIPLAAAIILSLVLGAWWNRPSDPNGGDPGQFVAAPTVETVATPDASATPMVATSGPITAAECPNLPQPVPVPEEELASSPHRMYEASPSSTRWSSDDAERIEAVARQISGCAAAGNPEGANALTTSRYLVEHNGVALGEPTVGSSAADPQLQLERARMVGMFGNYRLASALVSEDAVNGDVNWAFDGSLGYWLSDMRVVLPVQQDASHLSADRLTFTSEQGYWVFAKVDGQWLLDEQIPNACFGYCTDYWQNAGFDVAALPGGPNDPLQEDAAYAPDDAVTMMQCPSTTLGTPVPGEEDPILDAVAAGRRWLACGRDIYSGVATDKRVEQDRAHADLEGVAIPADIQAEFADLTPDDLVRPLPGVIGPGTVNLQTFQQSQARLLADGRVAMPMTYLYWDGDPDREFIAPAPMFSYLVVMKQVDGAWLIDDTYLLQLPFDSQRIDGTPETAPTALATPVVATSGPITAAECPNLPQPAAVSEEELASSPHRSYLPNIPYYELDRAESEAIVATARQISACQAAGSPEQANALTTPRYLAEHSGTALGPVTPGSSADDAQMQVERAYTATSSGGMSSPHALVSDDAANGDVLWTFRYTLTYELLDDRVVLPVQLDETHLSDDGRTFTSGQGLWIFVKVNGEWKLDEQLPLTCVGFQCADFWRNAGLDPSGLPGAPDARVQADAAFMPDTELTFLQCPSASDATPGAANANITDEQAAVAAARSWLACRDIMSDEAFTDDYLERQQTPVAMRPDFPEDLAALYSDVTVRDLYVPVSQPGWSAYFPNENYQLAHARVLSDGRIALIMSMLYWDGDPDRPVEIPETAMTTIVVMKQVDGEWLIDEMMMTTIPGDFVGDMGPVHHLPEPDSLMPTIAAPTATP